MLVKDEIFPFFGWRLFPHGHPWMKTEHALMLHSVEDDDPRSILAMAGPPGGGSMPELRVPGHHADRHTVSVRLKIVRMSCSELRALFGCGIVEPSAVRASLPSKEMMRTCAPDDHPGTSA